VKWLGRGFQVKFGCGIFAVLLVEFDLTFEMIRDIVLEFINKLRAIGAYPQLLWVALWLR